MPELGVNIDHVATLRQARREGEPDPVVAALIAQNAGAHAIVFHLREDRRHIQDSDVRNLKKALRCRLNFELSLAPDIVRFAARIKPDYAMFVPESRQEITTEGGLDVIKNTKRIERAAQQLRPKGVLLSVFVDPVKKQIRAAANLGADIVELHTGAFSNARSNDQRKKRLKKIMDAADYAHSLGLTIHAGHGLKYHNAGDIAKIPHIEELNIGHAIISRAVFTGLEKAVKDMKKILVS